MKKALITGVSGFVGKKLANHLVASGYQVWGTTRRCSPLFLVGVTTLQLDLDDKDRILGLLEKVRPDVIFHLSGQSSVKKSWESIEETFKSNVINSINLFEAASKYSKKQDLKIITVGSSEEYGLGVISPINETMDTNPVTPYGLSKLTLCKLAEMYSKSFDLNIIHARAFNHIGPGQGLGFVTADFAKQIVEIEKGISQPVIFVGNLNSKRDFTDVRDIVEAYRMLYEKGRPKEVYNVCSGKSISIREILNCITSFSNKSIEILIDESKFRPVDIEEYYGANTKIFNDTGWEPKFTLRDSLYDIYQYWKAKVV